MNGPGSLSSGLLRAGPESSVDQALQALARVGVAIDCPDQVHTYLGHYPGLTPHVVPAVQLVRQTFGARAELTLTINDDPEAFDPYLRLYISLPEYGPDTLARINQIQEPLDEATAGQDGFFLLTTDHRVVRG
jgi:hypothetical protein